ncbi:MAG: peptidoglycan DD-metalloendopeptidase family protein [Flavobacteriales bacterium]|nr:peptidoglycan DD-metalloendopeptidase family protein [Flavobacteriales bacterium]
MSKFIIKRIVLLLLLACGMFNSGQAQSKKSLQRKKQKLQKEIKYTNQLLKENAKTKSTSLNQLRQLNRKITSRQSLIETIKQEITFLDDSIALQVSNVDSLEANLTLLKQEYAEMIRHAYRNRSSYNKLMFLFSADNFNQAFKRLKYFQQYAQYRQGQAKKIEAEREVIDAQIRILEAIRKSKEGLLKAELNERKELASEKSQKEKVVSSLKGKEKQLKADLEKKRKASREIANAIEKIIVDEIRKAREAAAKKGKSKKGFPMTPEARELSNSFTANKGKLPWPVAEGVIISQFGENPHPTLANVTVQNNGIDISTKKESVGRASFNGTVSKIIIIPGTGKAVLINHGSYFTVYTYFKEVFVTSGDKVNTKQDLGILINESGESSAIMHFEIYKMGDSPKPIRLNPEKWIYKN